MSLPSKLEHMNSETCVNKAAIIINLSASYYSLYFFWTSIDVTLFCHAAHVTTLIGSWDAISLCYIFFSKLN